MTRKLRDSVLVITGASGGIGRATALEAARKGATMLLVARREQALQELAAECERLGGRAMAVPADVRNEDAVRDLARRGIENYGRIDCWINNAAVTLFARFEEAPPDVYRQVIETNLFGYIHGARAALPYFREQGSGVLINVSSVIGKVGQPYTSAYVATKFAIRGLSECLRQELLDAKGIHVSTVLPAAIDTPLYQQGGNYTGKAAKPFDPVYAADEVARAIVRCAEHPKREITVGEMGHPVSILHTVAPGTYERMGAKMMDKDHFMDAPVSPTPGNIFEPMPQWARVSGGWPVTARAVRGGAAAVATTGLVALGGAAVAGWMLFRPQMQSAQRNVQSTLRKQTKRMGGRNGMLRGITGPLSGRKWMPGRNGVMRDIRRPVTGRSWRESVPGRKK